MDSIFIVLKIKLTTGVHMSLPWCYIHVYGHNSQHINWYISQISGERLQDHLSSGLNTSHY